MCPLPFYLLMRLAQTGRNQKFNSRQRFFSREQPPLPWASAASKKPKPPRNAYSNQCTHSGVPSLAIRYHSWAPRPAGSAR